MPSHRRAAAAATSPARALAAVLLLAPTFGAAAAENGEAASAIVYRNAGDAGHPGHWTGLMPASCAGRVSVDPAQPEEGTGGGTVVRIGFELAVPGWCGVVVQTEPGYWGERPGSALAAAGATALVFRARGALGGEGIRVKAGIAPDQPFGDSTGLPLDSGWLVLSAGWQEYRIEATGRDLSRLITPFVVIANDKYNPSGRLTVFVDDIRYAWAR